MGVRKIKASEFARTAPTRKNTNWRELFGVESWSELLVPGAILELTPKRPLTEDESVQFVRMLRQLCNRKGYSTTAQRSSHVIRFRVSA